MTKGCSIEGCGKDAKARGWCSMHWKRWRTTGDPNLTNGTPKGEPQRFMREAAFLYDGNECLLWPYGVDNKGVARVWNGSRMEPAARIVCSHANGPPPSYMHEAAHSCGNGHIGCISKKHLRWKTHSENMAEMVEHGRSTRGERSKSAKLTLDQVEDIRVRRGTILQREMADEFGVANTTICKIQIGQRWEWAL